MLEGFWKGKVVLITGAEGFIGAHLARELLEQEAVVVSIEREGRSPSTLDLLGIHERVISFQGDVADHTLVGRVLREWAVDTCFHLAAQSTVDAAKESPLATFETNIRGTYCVLEACRTAQLAPRVVIASSDKVYGKQPIGPCTEDLPLFGLFPYDASKSCADILGRCYHQSYGLPVGVCRIANVYGPGDLNFSRLIPGCIRSALEKERFVIRSDGKSERDYLFIKDAVRAYLVLAANVDRSDIAGQAFNFGTEKCISVLELSEKIGALVGQALPAKILGAPRDTNDRQYVSAKKARNLLGWAAEHTLERGLSETVEWYKIAHERRLLPRDSLVAR